MLDKSKQPATVTTGTLQERALLVSLSIGRWSASKTDKSATDAVHRRAGAADEAGKYRKSLLPKDASKPLTKIMGAARAEHYKRSLPWGSNGQRILSVAAYMDYTAAMNEFASQYEAAVAEFVKDFDTNLDEARAILGSMFDPNDYPSHDEVLAAHTFKVETLPMPSADDFRVDLGKAEMDRIRADTESRLQEAQTNAMKDVYMRVHKAVSSMAERLGDPEAIFHNTLVTNLEELVDIMPMLNISQDPALVELADVIHQKLTQYGPEVLRANGKARAETAREAKALLTKVSEYSGVL